MAHRSAPPGRLLPRGRQLISQRRSRCSEPRTRYCLLPWSALRLPTTRTTQDNSVTSRRRWFAQCRAVNRIRTYGTERTSACTMLIRSDRDSCVRGVRCAVCGVRACYTAPIGGSLGGRRTPVCKHNEWCTAKDGALTQVDRRVLEHCLAFGQPHAHATAQRQPEARAVLVAIGLRA